MRKYETFEDVRLLAQDILAGVADPNRACALIAAISAKLQYPPSLAAFSCLTHDQTEHEHVGILAADCVDDIFEACRVLIEVKQEGR